MLIDISVEDYLKFLENKKSNVLKEIERFFNDLRDSLPSYRIAQTILSELDWLQEKKCEISEIEEKIALLKEM